MSRISKEVYSDCNRKFSELGYSHEREEDMITYYKNSRNVVSDLGYSFIGIYFDLENKTVCKLGDYIGDTITMDELAAINYVVNRLGWLEPNTSGSD